LPIGADSGHNAAFEGDPGPTTGGMARTPPMNDFSGLRAVLVEKIVVPTIAASLETACLIRILYFLD